MNRRGTVWEFNSFFEILKELFTLRRIVLGHGREQPWMSSKENEDMS
jgi:hypothetical protein